MTCLRCHDLERQLAEAHAVVTELWQQARLREQLQAGRITDWNPEPPPLRSLLAGRVIEDAA